MSADGYDQGDAEEDAARYAAVHWLRAAESCAWAADNGATVTRTPELVTCSECRAWMAARAQETDFGYVQVIVHAREPHVILSTGNGAATVLHDNAGYEVFNGAAWSDLEAELMVTRLRHIAGAIETVRSREGAQLRLRDGA